METMKDIRAHFASAKEGEYNALFQHYENDERSGVQKLIQQFRKKLQALENERARTEIMKEYEHKYEHLGYLCGIDEVGRGPLAGPVVACAVILPKDCDILWLNDSKKLTAKKREELYDVILEGAVFERCSYHTGGSGPSGTHYQGRCKKRIHCSGKYCGKGDQRPDDGRI